ncbi:mobilization protein [Cellulophaga geojensis KL-A]|uniref:Mobilization protein n=1 Tax=Cellulophaga geojensis KL-A TaxID=1328323 RepID=A0ABP3B3P6_9FLAO|nr:relaxase/mobilization nuclease domain-containing protein [Cellulophaga geojensis]EWH10556.1 mobilization protein [Cellulophaga geojensis KL-A]
MISKGKSISHTEASIGYGWNQEKDAKIVFKKSLVGSTPKEITNEFKTIQAMNSRCLKNTFSFVLSPTIEDGKSMKLRDFYNITNEFVEDLGLNDHQSIAFLHQDKEHRHIHLYVNRIDFNGCAYKDNYISKRAQKAAERVAKKLGLKTVKDVKLEKLDGLKAIRSNIKEKHDICLNSLRSKSINEYIVEMRKLGVNVIPVINKSNNIQGFRYQFKNINLKGSEVHRNLSFNKIKQQLLKVEGVKYKSINI